MFAFVGGCSDTLKSGETLGIDQSLYSANNKFRLTMEASGKLKIWGPSQGMWSTGTSTPNSYGHMQSDGNFVIYKIVGTTWNVIWQTYTAGNPGSKLKITNDGQMIIINASGQSIRGYGRYWPLPTNLMPANAIVAPHHDYPAWDGGGNSWGGGSGTPMYSMVSGTVTYASHVDNNNCGKYVKPHSSRYIMDKRCQRTDWEPTASNDLAFQRNHHRPGFEALATSDLVS